MPKSASRSPEDFEGMLQASIAEGMSKVLGTGGAQAIFYHLGMSRFHDAEKFHQRLTTIFGVGTTSLERVIIQHLHQTMGVEASHQDDDFVAQVERARRQFDRLKLERHH